jgi:hypothetical protein
MKIRSLYAALILGGLVAANAPATSSLAQSGYKGSARAQDTATPAANVGAAPNVTTTPTKHRYWRHRGGRHPHYGSRRLGS